MPLLDPLGPGGLPSRAALLRTFLCWTARPFAPQEPARAVLQTPRASLRATTRVASGTLMTNSDRHAGRFFCGERPFVIPPPPPTFLFLSSSFPFFFLFVFASFCLNRPCAFSRSQRGWTLRPRLDSSHGTRAMRVGDPGGRQTHQVLPPGLSCLLPSRSHPSVQRVSFLASLSFWHLAHRHCPLRQR